MGPLRTIGGYDVLGELGRGGMGVVLRARHRATGAARAIKLLDGAPEPEALARFQREAEALARAEGLGVVPIHESGFEQGRFFYTMGLYEGGSLRGLLRARGRLEWRVACQLVAKLARTLERCHERGLVHRDLKPENVLLDERGEPWVADFGCARDLSAQRLTITGEMIGTVGYMPPEQLEGLRADARADVFALGVVLHELITGSLPFLGRSPVQQILAIRETRVTPPSLVAGSPRELDSIILGALAADVRARTVTASELGAALEGLLEGTAVPAKPKPRPGQTAAFVRIATSGVLAGVVLGGGAWLAWTIWRARTAVDDPAAAAAARVRAAVAETLAGLGPGRRSVVWSQLEQNVLALGEPGRAALDAAAAAGSLEARELRVHLAARGGPVPDHSPPVLAEDVKALAARPEVCDEVAHLVLRPGIAGDDRVAAARALTQAAPTSRDAALLLAVELLSQGTDAASAEAKGLLGSPPPGAARVLATTLERAEAAGQLYAALAYYVETSLKVDLKPLVQSIGDLRKAGLSRALPGLLRPLEVGARTVVHKLPTREPAPERIQTVAAPIETLLLALRPDAPGAVLPRVRRFLTLDDATVSIPADALDEDMNRCVAGLGRDACVEGTIFFLAYLRRTKAPDQPRDGVDLSHEHAVALHARTRAAVNAMLDALERCEDDPSIDARAWSREVRFNIARNAADLVDSLHAADHEGFTPAERADLTEHELRLRLRAVEAVLGAGVDVGAIASVLGSAAALCVRLGRAQDAFVILGLSLEYNGKPADAAAKLEEAWSLARSDAERRDAAIALAIVALERNDVAEAEKWVARSREGSPARPPLLRRPDAATLAGWIQDSKENRRRR